MGFNVYYLPAVTIENIEFNKVESIEKVLDDIQLLLLLHVATNLTNLFCKKLRETSTPQKIFRT